MNHFFYVLIFSLMLFSCERNSNNPIVIRKVDLYDKIDSSFSEKGELFRKKNDFFIIENFHGKEQDSVAIFDFVRKARKNKEFSTYTANFYKESSITNIKKIKSGPGEITGDSDDKDLIYTIIWQTKKWSIYSYKSGKELYSIYRDSL